MGIKLTKEEALAYVQKIETEKMKEVLCFVLVIAIVLVPFALAIMLMDRSPCHRKYKCDYTCPFYNEFRGECMIREKRRRKDAL